MSNSDITKKLDKLVSLYKKNSKLARELDKIIYDYQEIYKDEPWYNRSFIDAMQRVAHKELQEIEQENEPWVDLGNMIVQNKCKLLLIIILLLL